MCAVTQHKSKTQQRNKLSEYHNKVSIKGNFKKLECLQESDENLLGMLEHYGHLFDS